MKDDYYKYKMFVCFFHKEVVKQQNICYNMSGKWCKCYFSWRIFMKKVKKVAAFMSGFGIIMLFLFISMDLVLWYRQSPCC